VGFLQGTKPGPPATFSYGHCCPTGLNGQVVPLRGKNGIFCIIIVAWVSRVAFSAPLETGQASMEYFLPKICGFLVSRHSTQEVAGTAVELEFCARSKG
jgi:hypothetical protein